MKFSIKREIFLQPLSQVVGVVERRQTLPVLANFLVQAREDGKLSITGTDMEVELIANVDAAVQRQGEITVPARKLLDIVRMLPDGVEITVNLDGDKLTVSSGRSRYTLATLPATDFPATDQFETIETVDIPEDRLSGFPAPLSSRFLQIDLFRFFQSKPSSQQFENSFWNYPGICATKYNTFLK